METNVPQRDALSVTLILTWTTIGLLFLAGCRGPAPLVDNPPFLAASTDIVDFETHAMGTEAMRTVYLINKGDRPLTLELPEGDTVGGVFAIILDEYEIAPNAHVLARVYFSPYEPFQYETKISIRNNSVNEGNFELMLLGVGFSPAPCDTVDCTQPPAPACISSTTSRIYEPMGDCIDGSCHHNYNDENCPYGCNYETGLCQGDPCSGLTCDNPPNSCYMAQGVCLDGACQFTANNDAICDDDNLCTVSDGCVEGNCIGTPVVCDAPPVAICLNENVRRSWAPQGACNPFNGTCEYQMTEQYCEFGCTSDGCIGDPCVGLACETPPNSCYGEVGACIDGSCNYEPVTGSCNDGDACTVADSCQNGTCTGIPVTCNAPPASECTSSTSLRVYNSTGSCSQGACSYGSSTVTCNDYNACTVNDHCSGGACQTGAMRNCDDGNPCTVDSCDPAVGCRHEPVTGGACNRGGDCPIGQCISGSCLAVPDVTCTTEVDVDLCVDQTIAGRCTGAEGMCPRRGGYSSGAHMPWLQWGLYPMSYPAVLY